MSLEIPLQTLGVSACKVDSTMNTPFPAAEQIGLSHLMEAATALAELTESVAPSPVPIPVGQQIAIDSTQAQNHETKIADLSCTSAVGEASSTLGADAANKEIFPARLMAILSDPTLSEVVTWLPHGRSFVVLRPDVFTEQVLPKYVPAVDPRASTKYPSFTRKVNRWGFRQALRGPDTGAFFHPLFRRDKPELCLDMVCQRARDRQKKETKLPAKKRQVAILTKESLDAMDKKQASEVTASVANPESSASPLKCRATVSVADDSKSTHSSVTSRSIGKPDIPPLIAPLLRSSNGITCDVDIVHKAIAQRDEEERIRVAKVMLYHAFLQASRGE